MRKKISEAVNNIKDEYIEEAVEYKAKSNKKKTWLRWGAIAACFAIVAVIGLPVIGDMVSSKNDASGGGYDNYSSEIMQDAVVKDDFNYGYADKESSISDSSSSITDSATDSTDRKIIVTINYNIETKDLDKAVKDLENMVASSGGYYESSNVRGNTQSGGSGDYVIRIPTDKVDGFTGGINSLGNITSQSRTGKDITADYFDTETRLKALKIQEERLLALLSKAEVLSDILQLESELTDVRIQIEALTTVLQKYDNLVEYTTVKIYINQVKTYTPVSEKSFIKEVSETFCSAFESAGEFCGNLILGFIWVLPYLLFVAVVIVIIVIIVKIKNKKK